MIFHRRVIQAELDNLRRHLNGFVVDRLVKRLNAVDRDRLSALWEVVIISALCELGPVEVEAATKSGRQPDISFQGKPTFIADITSISDAGLEERNPVRELETAIGSTMVQLGLSAGGLNYRIEGQTKRVGSGQRVDLRIPNRDDISDFVDRRIAPAIKSGIETGQFPIRIEINDTEAELTIEIDPSKGPYSTGSYPSFDVTEAIDRNPFAYALQRKAEQLQDAEGLRGIFVCDTGSSSIQNRMFGGSGFKPSQIVEHFLRTNDHIDFVMTLAVWEQQFGIRHHGKPDRRVDMALYAKRGLPCENELRVLAHRLAERIPKPRATGENGRRQANVPIYSLGFHGGYTMTSKSVKISLREMTEVLSGKLTVAEIKSRYAGFSDGDCSFPNQFEHLLRQGRLPVGVKIVPGATADDDWIEFSFGEPDAAISKFR